MIWKAYCWHLERIWFGALGHCLRIYQFFTNEHSGLLSFTYGHLGKRGSVVEILASNIASKSRAQRSIIGYVATKMIGSTESSSIVMYLCCMCTGYVSDTDVCTGVNVVYVQM